MITIEELKNKIEEIGYIATEELLYDMFNALDTFFDEEINPGQDIFSICLEGPPGAGKTEFAKVYTKICNELFHGNVEMVDYQCDATTGKNELFEDINISSAIRHDADHVNIPGKLVEAIQKVNQGKKVILFIDEYDKAREETDAFFLQLLQSGKINAVQYGDLEIKEEYKTNLQVIFCKNDMREEVSGPLSRRMRILRLDYMTPENFYRVAYRELIFEKQKQVDEGLLNLVTLMYEHAYDMRDLYKRLPACSEMLIAITDADRLLKKANAPQHVIYQVIIKNMFKSLDDQKTFESSFENQKEQKTEKLYDLIKQMKEKKEENQKVDINHLIALKIFNDQSAKFAKKIEEMQKLIEEYKEKFSMLEKRKEQTIEKEKQKILLENGSLISTNKPLKVMKNFEDESANIKRGYNIFEQSNQDWTDLATMKIPRLSHHFFLEKLMQYASNLEIKIYENGILLKEEGDQKVIVIQDFDENHEQRYRMLSNYPVVPSTAILDIENFLSFALETYQLQDKTVGQIEEDALESMGTYDIHALIYNDFPLELEEVKDHVYSMIRKDKIENLEELKKITNMFSCKEKDQAVFTSKEILKGKRKVLTHE